MIVRVFTNKIKPGKREAFERFFTGKAIANVRKHAGCVNCIYGMPRDGDDTWIMVTVWRDLDALIAFAGPNWQNPYIDPDEADIIEDVRVVHYEGGLG